MHSPATLFPRGRIDPLFVLPVYIDNAELSGGNRRFSFTVFSIPKRSRIAVSGIHLRERLTSCANALLC